MSSPRSLFTIMIQFCLWDDSQVSSVTISPVGFIPTYLLFNISTWVASEMQTIQKLTKLNSLATSQTLSLSTHVKK